MAMPGLIWPRFNIMNILYVSQWFSSIGGGGEIVFYEIANGMTKFGHKVTIISESHADIHDDMSNDRLSIHRVRPVLHGPPPPSLRQNIGYIFNAVFKGLCIIRNKEIDIIHANNFSSALVGVILSKLFSLPLIVTIHALYGGNKNFWRDWAAQPNISPITSMIAPIAEKFTYKVSVDAIHTVSNSTKMDLIDNGAKSEIKVIYNGINLDEYDRFGVKNDYQDFVLFIGRLVFHKNLEVVISSFSEVRKYLPDAKLVIVGDGPMRSRWEKMVSQMDLKSNISFRGYVSRNEKVELLSHCSALLIPSAGGEGMALVLLEAFAIRRPVLVSAVGSSEEVVDDGIDGFILPPNDPLKWSEKIIFLLSNKGICKEMGNRGRQKIEKKFNLKRTLAEMDILYNQILKKKNKDI